MKNINPSLAIIIVSIIFAVAIILVAGQDNSQSLIFMLIAVWFIPFGYFIQLKAKHIK